MVYAQTIICPWEWDAQNSLGFEIQMDPGQKTRPRDIKQKRELAK